MFISEIELAIAEPSDATVLLSIFTRFFSSSIPNPSVIDSAWKNSSGISGTMFFWGSELEAC